MSTCAMYAGSSAVRRAACRLADIKTLRTRTLIHRMKQQACKFDHKNRLGRIARHGRRFANVAEEYADHNPHNILLAPYRISRLIFQPRVELDPQSSWLRGHFRADLHVLVGQTVGRSSGPKARSITRLRLLYCARGQHSWFPDRFKSRRTSVYTDIWSRIGTPKCLLMIAGGEHVIRPEQMCNHIWGEQLLWQAV